MAVWYPINAKISYRQYILDKLKTWGVMFGVMVYTGFVLVVVEGSINQEEFPLGGWQDFKNSAFKQAKALAGNGDFTFSPQISLGKLVVLLPPSALSL